MGTIGTNERHVNNPCVIHIPLLPFLLTLKSEVVSYLAHQTLEGKLADQVIRRLLVVSYLAQRYTAWQYQMQGSENEITEEVDHDVCACVPGRLRGFLPDFSVFTLTPRVLRLNSVRLAPA